MTKETEMERLYKCVCGRVKKKHVDSGIAPDCECGRMMESVDEAPRPYLQPLHDQIVARPVFHRPPGEKIKLIDWKDPFPMARVLYVGPGVRLESGQIAPMTVKVGDLICTMKSEAESLYNGEVLIFTSESSVRSICHNEDVTKLTEGISEAEAREAQAEIEKLKAEARAVNSGTRPGGLISQPGHSYPPGVAGRRH